MRMRKADLRGRERRNGRAKRVEHASAGKTKEQRRAANDKKPGAQSRFPLAPAVFLERRLIDKRKGAKGKMQRLDGLWYRVTAWTESWEKFSYEDSDADGDTKVENASASWSKYAQEC